MSRWGMCISVSLLGFFRLLMHVTSYSIYRRVVGYYHDDTDAFDMRKSLRRDKGGKHVREKGETFKVSPEDVW